MSVDRRKSKINWIVTDDDGNCYGTDSAQLAVLMDLRDELQKLNAVFACSNFQEIPKVLRDIRTKLPTRKESLGFASPRFGSNGFSPAAKLAVGLVGK